MELTSSMSINCIKGHGLDDDVFSNISRISCGLRNSLNSTCNSDSECSGPVSVRHMIQQYNNQLKQSESANRNSTFKINSARKHHHPSQYLLAATKSSYCGLNNYGTSPSVNCHQFADQIEHDNHSNTCCKSCTACTCCRNRSRKNSTANLLSSTSSSFLLLQPNENSQKPNNDCNMNSNSISGTCIRSSSTNCNKINAKDTRNLAVENCSDNINAAADTDDVDINADTTTASSNKPTILKDFCAEQKDSSSDLYRNNYSPNEVEKENNRLMLIDSADEANICQQPAAETSYQSKTTIAKTSSGVRIIVDIFFDQERCADVCDVVGRRVETDIPQSRILSEFQQQTMDSNASLNSYQQRL